jgi:hypothetical protein
MNNYNNNNKIGSAYDDGSYLATNTDNFTNFTPLLVSNQEYVYSQIDQTNEDVEIAVNYDMEGEDAKLYPQYITYIDHPIIKNKFNMENELSITEDDTSTDPLSSGMDVNIHFDKIVHFYFGSLAIVGLFILFRSIQKSKY